MNIVIQTFQQRDFALLWAGQLISKVGDWILWIALPFYIYEKTGSAFATGAMFIATNLPTLLFSSWAGVFVDRWNRKNTMIGADLLRAIIILLLLLIHSARCLWLLYPLAFAQSLASQFFTPAKSAIMPTLVSQKSLTVANMLSSISGDVAMMIGPAISGFLYSMVGLTGVILIDAFSFVLSAILIGGIRLPTNTKHMNVVEPVAIRKFTWTELWQQWISGLTAIKQNSTISILFAATGVANIGNGIILVCWVIHVREVLGEGAILYGWVQVAVATGGILAGFFMPMVHQFFTPRHLITMSGVSVGLLLLATFNVRSIPLILGLQLLMGIVAISFYVPIETLLQSSADSDLLGRVFGAYGTTSALFVLIGQAIATILGDRLGTTLLLDFAALMALLGGACAIILPSTKQ